MKSIEEIVNNFKLTLNANPVLEAVINSQMEAKILGARQASGRLSGQF